MANEVTLSASIRFQKGGTDDGLAVAEKLVTITGTLCVHQRQIITTAGTDILDIGGILLSGLTFIVNRDSTNYVELRKGVGGSDMIRLYPGVPNLFQLKQDAVGVPIYATANTASCEIEVFTVSF